MKKKLILINPINKEKDNLAIYRFAPPLSLGMVAALTPNNWDVEIIDEAYDKMVYKEADLVGITAYTPSANRAYQIAASFRAKDIPVVMGGIHASLLTDEALNYVDTVVKGEAEGSWGKVIADFEAGNLQKLYYCEPLPMDNAPWPRRDLFSPRYLMGSLQTTRGCPNHCDFCSVSIFNGKRYRRRPVEEVLNELESMPQKHIFFVDDNMVEIGKAGEERAISLFKGMIKRNLNKEWGCQTSINVANNEEVLYYAAKSGCQMFIIGIESEKEATLKDLGKNVNLSLLEEYNSIFKKIQKYKIGVFGSFIFGTDSDSIEDLYKRVEFIKKSRVSVTSPPILTPFPGTKVHDDFQKNNRILSKNYPKDWDRYNFTNINYTPALMTPEELQDAMIICWKNLSSAKYITLKAIKTFLQTRNFLAFLVSIKGNLVFRDVLRTSIKRWEKEYKDK